MASPVCASHRRKVPSHDQDSSRPPSRAVTPTTGSGCPSKVAMASPVCASHRRKVWSCDQDSSRPPSSVVTPNTPPVCPSRVARASPVCASHRRKVWSSDQDSSRPSSSAMAPHTASVCPSRMARASPVCASHRRKVWSHAQDSSRPPSSARAPFISPVCPSRVAMAPRTSPVCSMAPSGKATGLLGFHDSRCARRCPSSCARMCPPSPRTTPSSSATAFSPCHSLRPGGCSIQRFSSSSHSHASVSRRDTAGSPGSQMSASCQPYQIPVCETRISIRWMSESGGASLSSLVTNSSNASRSSKASSS